MLKKNKKLKKLKVLIIVSIIMLLILSVICVLLLSNLFKKDIYKIDSRINNIKQEQKNDNKEFIKTIGWLRVQGTKVDAPIITYYYDSEEDIAITDDQAVNKYNYLWNLDTSEKHKKKIVVIGHNLLNLSAHPDVGLKQFSRFDDLMAFVYYDFVKDNKYLQYTIDGKDYIYKIFSVSFIDDGDVNESDVDLSKKETEKYIKKSKDSSIYKFGVDVNKDDDIISLVTCTRMFGKKKNNFRVDARLLRKNERTTNYSVRKTKKYKEVEEVLKGDEEDEEA